jgi:hypothetical protein
MRIFEESQGGEEAPELKQPLDGTGFDSPTPHECPPKPRYFYCWLLFTKQFLLYV